MATTLEIGILALDSYNRGYHAALGNDSNGLGGVTSNIGNFSLLTDSTLIASTSAAAQSAGFFASAYRDLKTNEIVIDPPPIIESGFRVYSDTDFGLKLWRFFHGKKALYGGADYRVAAPG